MLYNGYKPHPFRMHLWQLKSCAVACTVQETRVRVSGDNVLCEAWCLWSAEEWSRHVGR